MVIRINTYIVVMVLNLISVQNFSISIILGVDMSSSVHYENKGKDTIILGKRPTQGLDDATLTPEAQYSINFSRSNKNFA